MYVTLSISNFGNKHDIISLISRQRQGVRRELMSNTIQYVKQYANVTFDQMPLNAIDILILTEIGYLEFEDIISDSLDQRQGRTLKEAADLYMTVKDERLKNNWVLNTKNRVTLLSEAGQVKRYESIYMYGYVNEIDLEIQKQFSAIMYGGLPDGVILAFRGTDDTLIGWKEDFQMTYLKKIPSQESAKEYLQKLVDVGQEPFIITGHSKGGNLAVYAAATAKRQVQKQLQAVFSFDGPGTNKTLVQSRGYQAIRDKIHAFIPQDSVVGKMLESDVVATVVKSNALGLIQHNSFTWQIKDNKFVELPETTKSSAEIDKTLTTWMYSLSDEELKEFFDIFFGLLFQTGVKTLGDVSADIFKTLQAVLNESRQLDDNKREMMIRIARLLFDTRYEVWADNFKKQVESLGLSNFELPQVDLAAMNPVDKLLPKKTGNIKLNPELSEESERLRLEYQKKGKEMKN